MIIHIHYDHLSYSGSGSSNRPEQIKEGFENAGFALEVVEGDWSSRKSISQDLMARLRQGWRPEFLYAESSTTPYVFGHPWKWPFHDMDIQLMRECAGNGIPVGLFYRDVHWKFVRARNLKQWLIKMIYRPFHQLELKQYKRYSDLIFLPSLEMGTHLGISESQSASLPPAARSEGVYQHTPEPSDEATLKAVHVGGLTDAHGLYDLRPICRSLLDKGIQTTIVCRDSDWNRYSHHYRHLIDKGLIVKHIHGKELYPFLSTFDFGLLCYPFHEYRSFAFPYKVFEYLQCGLTILHDSDVSVARWIQKNNVGIQLERIAKRYDIPMEKLQSSSRSKGRLRRIQEVLNRNTWRDRAQYVAETLTGS